MVSRKPDLGNVVRKLHQKFHRVSFIRKRFKIGVIQNLTMKQNDTISGAIFAYFKVAYKLKFFRILSCRIRQRIHTAQENL